MPMSTVFAKMFAWEGSENNNTLLTVCKRQQKKSIARHTKRIFTITTQLSILGWEDNHYFPAGAELWLSAGAAFDGFQGGLLERERALGCATLQSRTACVRTCGPLPTTPGPDTSGGGAEKKPAGCWPDGRDVSPGSHF